MFCFIFHDFIDFECEKFLFDDLLYKIKHMTEYTDKTSRILPHGWRLRLLARKIIIKKEMC
jgi:hypothetical protein